MYHYVYLLEFPDGMKYVGAKSRNYHPSLDECYLGSGRALPKDRNRHNCRKSILGIYDTRKEAINAEIAYIKANNCCESGEYYNQRVSTYDRHGVTKETCSGAAASSRIQQGRTRETHEYLRIKGDKFKQYAGANRTAAQKAADQQLRETTKGIKNPAKGNSGISNSGFTPWYYITPEGDYHEMHSVTRKDCAATLGFTERQMEHRFHHSNIHKPGKTKPAKGWVFGTLPRPTDTGTD